jgi:type I restriction enzyme S subunit
MPSIVKPSLEELLDSLTRFADAATAQASMLTTLRDQLLPKLMSGELRVEDAEKQVEEVV